MIRYRLGNEMKESTYWEEEERKVCRLWEHVWERCREWATKGERWEEAVRRILGGEKDGEGFIRMEKEMDRGVGRTGREVVERGGREGRKL